MNIDIKKIDYKDRKTQLILAGTAAVLFILWSIVSPDEADKGSYRTAKIERGDIRHAVSASGTLSALVTVEVGTQLSGQIIELHADFNSEVKKNQLIARIDPATFETRVSQAEAEVAIAKANVAQANAAKDETRANQAKAERSLKRAEDLRKRGNISTSQLDTATADSEMANARLASSDAQVITAEAQVKQREASLKSAQVELERTYIRSPVDGVIIGRDVDIGQTVAASLQAPILFTIAQDLSQMQLEVNVDEADIGNIIDDQSVFFTVDAYPTRSFSGRVEQIRKAPQIEQNVVTYTVIVSAHNEDQSLLPGMTANVEVVIEEHKDVLLVPNRALRFTPEEKKIDRASRDSSKRTIWQLTESSKLEAAYVVIGLSDGFLSEISSTSLKEGDEVVIALKRSSGPQLGPPGPGGRR
jgi:HlyD family secretion protein